MGPLLLALRRELESSDLTSDATLVLSYDELIKEKDDRSKIGKARRKAEVKTLLGLLGIDFYTDTGSPTVHIRANTKLRITATPEPVPLLNQHQEKTEYTERMVNITYNKVGLGDIEEQVRNIYNGVGWNETCRELVFEKFFTRFSDISPHISPCTSKRADDNAEIVSSIQQRNNTKG